MELNIESIANNFFPDVPSNEHMLLDEEGWTTTPPSVPGFVQPPLIVNDEDVLYSSKIWLISAPGAVGKSSFAKQLTLKTKAIYINLAKAGTIGANYLSGALFNSNLIDALHSHSLALLIDAIDEASLRVTFESRIDFYKDIIRLSKNNKFPIIIFGRQASINEGHLILEEYNVTPALITIDYFERNDAIQFVKNMIMEKLSSRALFSSIKSFKQHEQVAEKVIRNTLESLDQTASICNKNFSGYAPVLDAVAEYIYPESNFNLLDQESRNILDAHLLNRLCYFILKREQSKFQEQLGFENEYSKDLYNANEQMMALCHIYAGYSVKDIKFDSHRLPENKKQIYIKMAKEFIEQHPFLVDGKNPTNVVFAGAIQSFSIKYLVDCHTEIFHKHPVSPLFAEFYFNDDELYGGDIQAKANSIVKSEHIPLLLHSYEALSSQNTTICLDISDDDNSEYAKVSILRYGIGDTVQVLKEFKTARDGKLIFRKQVCALEIDCPSLEIEFEGNSAISINLPINIDVNKITFNCPALHFIGDGTITITAKTVDSILEKVDKFGKVDAYIGWPGSNEYPWTFSNQIEILEEHDAEKLQTALFSFCKLIRSFRSHSKGKLARFEDKIDHNRMSKNYGEKIKQYLLNEGIITHSAEKKMYYLNSDELAEKTSLSYQDIIKRNCSDKLLNILKTII